MGILFLILEWVWESLTSSRKQPRATRNKYLEEMYGAFIGSRVQRSNGMLEVKVLGRNIWRLFYDSLRQSFWQCATSAWKRKSRNRIKSTKRYWIGWSFFFKDPVYVTLIQMPTIFVLLKLKNEINWFGAV